MPAQPPPPPVDRAALEDLLALAAQLLDLPVAVLGRPVDGRWQLLAAHGTAATDWPLEPGLGLLPQEAGGLHVVEDALADPLARSHPLVTGAPHARYCATVPVHAGDGPPLAVLAALDTQPRRPMAEALAGLHRLAAVAARLLASSETLQRVQERAKLADVIPQIVWTATADGEVDSFSTETQRLTGGELEGRPGAWLDYLHPEDRERISQAWAVAVATGGPYRVECRIWNAPQGTHRWHLIEGRPTRDAEGRVQRWYGNTIDIHDRRMAEANLQRTEERLRTVIETQPESVKVVSADGRLVDANGAALRWMGLPDKSAALGRLLAEFVHPGDQAAFHAFLQAAQEGRRRQVSLRMVSARGVQRWMESRAAPIQLEDQRSAVVVASRDITQRRLAEAALEEAQKRTALILASTGDGIYGVEAHGRLNFINASALRMLGYREDELLGQDAQALFHQRPAASLPPGPAPLELTLRDGTSRQVEDAAFLRKDGTRLPVEYTVAAVKGEAGAIQGAVVSFRDVTARNRQSQLRALEARVLDLLSSAAPLRRILEEVTRTVDGLLTGVRSSVHLVAHGRLRDGVGPNLPPAFLAAVEDLAVAEGVGSCGTAAFRGEEVLVLDARTDPLWANFRHLVAEHDLRCCWSTPVVGGDGTVLASYALYRPEPDPPQPDEREVIVRVAQYVRVAIERTRQQEQVLRSERRYRSLYDLVPVAILEQDWTGVLDTLAGLRAQGVRAWEEFFAQHPAALSQALHRIRTLNVNQAALGLFGVDSAAQLKASMNDLFAGPEAQPGLVALMAAIARNADGGARELELRRRDGQQVCVWANVTLVGDEEDGHRGRALVSLLDVTARKEAEERFRTVAQTTSDVVWDWNLQTDAMWWSDGFTLVFGHPREHGSGQAWSELIHPADRPRVVASCKKAQEKDGPRHWRAEYRFVRADGSYAQVVDRGIVLRDPEGAALRMVGSMVDVTERRQLEEQLRQAQRLDAVGQLTGGIAHDFNNLLTVILGNAEMLVEELADDRALRQLPEVIVTAAANGADLANRLLAFARRQPLHPKVVDLEDHLAGMLPMLRRTLGEHIEVELEAAPALWMARVDPSQLENAILNLCINARDAMPTGGRLTLSAANVQLDAAQAAEEGEVAPGDYVLVTVADTGTGMDEATLKRVFDPFFTTKEVGKGSGLGLSMVYGFAKQSHGHVGIASRPGLGTVVRLYLPCAGSTEPTAEPSAPHGAELPGGSERVLLVEDNPLVRAHVAGQLRRLGYEVTEAADGPQALALLGPAAEFDLLFTDVVMPGGMSGPQLAEAARQRHPRLPVLFTSGYSENPALREGRFGPGMHLLLKPYRNRDLAAKLREVLAAAADPAPPHLDNT